MNKSIVFAIPIFLFLFMFFPNRALGQYQQEAITPTIVINQLNTKPITITFSTRELQEIQNNQNILLKKLGTETTRDCAYPRRISSCIWSCRNGRKIRTCHPTLVSALERLWPR
jgi:hypothetical protein